MRAEKAEKFKELKTKRNSKEFEEWFLNYRPEDNEKDIKSGKSSNKSSNDIDVVNGKKKQIKKSTKSKKRKQNTKKFNFNFWGKNKTKKNRNEIY
jgi:hypothetical protein